MIIGVRLIRLDLSRCDICCYVLNIFLFVIFWIVRFLNIMLFVRLIVIGCFGRFSIWNFFLLVVIFNFCVMAVGWFDIL